VDKFQFEECERGRRRKGDERDFTGRKKMRWK
jgi:hypothetical protein